ncbi:MAG: fatty acid desaturase, partial [Bacteroidota bacterium]
VIHQVVNDPDYKKVSEVPLISLHQLSLIFLAYLGFIGSIYLHLQFNLTLWLVYPLMGLSSYLAFTPLHDATHRAVSSNKLLNDILGSVSAFLLFPFLTTPAYRFLHMSHHRYVGDDDLDPDSILVSIPTRYYPFGFLILPVFDVVWIYWAFTKARFRLPRPEFRWLAFSTIGFILFYIAGFYFFGYTFLLLYVIPSRIGLAYTGYVFGTIQHPDGVRWDELPFESTHLIKGRETNLMVKSLLGQGFHAMHHFMPHVPWYKYHKVWELGNNIFSKQPIPERSLFAGLEKNAREKFLEAKQREITSVRVKVSAIEEVAKNVKSFTFESLDGEELPAFTAGSHIELSLPSDRKRSYSLVNPQFERQQYQIAVKREEYGKGGSKEMHEDVSTGDILTVSTPRNNFVLYEKAQRFILISGGIGITPLISMAHRLDELDKHFEFHICAREERDIPFRYELSHWPFAPMVEIHLDRHNRSSIDLSTVLANPNKDTLIYVCGPAGFNKWVATTAQEMRWDKTQIKQELFSAASTQVTPSRAFEVVLQKSGKTIRVPENMSIIDAVEMHHVSIDYSCLQGTCGTCICEVVEGEVDHRDAVLSEEEKIENKQICLCVSRAKEDRITLNI